MAALHLSEELIETLEREARTGGLSSEELLRSLLLRQQTLAERHTIEREQAWWLNQPLSFRARYEGQFVAVHHQELIDHDTDDCALRNRVRAKYGNEAILMMPAEGPREITIYSFRLVEE